MFEELKDTSRAFFEEIWNKGDLEAVTKYVAPEYVLYDPIAPGGKVQGIDALKMYVTTFRTAFPDLKFTIHDIVAEADHTAVRWSVSGTHKGEFMGIAPTLKSGTITGITFSKIVDGKTVESHVSRDDLTMFQLLGKVPQLFPELAKV